MNMTSRTRKKEVVVVGGGTGTHTVLSGLKRFHRELALCAIVAMTDSGGSTGRLRDEFGYLPVGDVRMALAALAREDGEHEQLLRRLFLHRFSTSGDVSGHNFGNLFLMALTDILGSEEAAIDAAAQVLRVAGRVIPVTREKTHLVATYEDGTVVVGERDIDESPLRAVRRAISSLDITPPATIHEHAAEALIRADCIIFGPGDLYTSVLANCVIPGFQEALRESNAVIVYISNLMTKRGQTDGMSLTSHISELSRYLGRAPHYAIVNTAELPPELLERYAAEDEYPVLFDGCPSDTTLIQGDLLARSAAAADPADVLRRSLIRHDPERLAQTLYAIIMQQ